METVLPLKLPPGMYKNGTRLQATGRWYEGTLVRFFDGAVRPLGGQTNFGVGGVGYASHMIAVPSAAHGYVLVFGDSTGFRIGYPVPPTGAGTAGFWPDGWGSNSYSGPINAVLTGTTNTTGDPSFDGTVTPPLIWQMDNFGDYVVAVDNHFGTPWIWQGDINTGPTAMAGAPTDVLGLVVTPERFIVALLGSSNPQKIQWAAQETWDQWAATANNNAGALTLATSGALVTGRRTTRETLLWTTTDLHRMTYVGEPFIYGVAPVAAECGIIGPHAVAIAGDTAFWMGYRSFFRYDGSVQEIPCEVADYVFGDMNRVQSSKVWAMTIAQFGEVWFFYPSSTAVDCDRYVIYNYLENHWTTGEMTRTAGIDAGVAPYPMLAAAANPLQTPPTQYDIYEHERGPRSDTNNIDMIAVGYQGSSNLPNNPAPYVETGPIPLDAAGRIVRVQQIMPDTTGDGSLNALFHTSFFPNGAETTSATYALDLLTSVRVTGRFVRLRFTETAPGDWKIGVILLGVIPEGRR